MLFTVYTDTGLAKTITMHFPDDDDFESTVEDCMTDFIDTFFDEKNLQMNKKLTRSWNCRKANQFDSMVQPKEPDLQTINTRNNTSQA